MKIVKIEWGWPTVVMVDEPGTVYTKEWKQEYVERFTQPISWFLISAIYHWYDMHSFWFWHRLDNWFPRTGDPFVVRQDERCFRLSHKYRIMLDRFYGEKVSKE